MKHKRRLLTEAILRAVLSVGIAVIFLCVGGCGRSDASRITDVLDRCAALSHRTSAFKEDHAAQALFVALEFQKIDVTACPADFRVAFQAHTFAWLQAARALANERAGKHELGVVVASPQSRIVGTDGDPTAVAMTQVNATYFDLTQIAARYGARIPTSIVGM